MFERGRTFDKHPSEAAEKHELVAAVEPKVDETVFQAEVEKLQPPPVFEITGPLSEVADPAARTILQNIIDNLVETGRAVDETT